MKMDGMSQHINTPMITQQTRNVINTYLLRQNVVWRNNYEFI